MVVFEVEKVVELFWSVMVECKKVVKTEKSRVTPRYTADPNSARRAQLIDMSGGGSNTRGCAFLYGPGAGDMPESEGNARIERAIVKSGGSTAPRILRQVAS